MFETDVDPESFERAMRSRCGTGGSFCSGGGAEPAFPGDVAGFFDGKRDERLEVGRGGVDDGTAVEDGS
jgi:hypothetical protein